MAMDPRKRRLLEGFAKDYAEMSERIERRCEKFTTPQLVELETATEVPTQTNCWWATYRVASLVKAAAARELHQRRLREEREKNAEPQTDAGVSGGR